MAINVGLNIIYVCSETFSLMHKVYTTDYLSRTQAYSCYARLKDGKENAFQDNDHLFLRIQRS